MDYIGKVALDYKYYSGEDLYCDGSSEDVLLDIVKNHEIDEYNKIIFEKKDWPIMYHLHQARGNIVRWIDFKDSDEILEIGSGCGAITGVLAESSKLVDCVELSKKRSMINAFRNKDKESITITVGNFEDVEFEKKYDYITLIGVLEYSASYLKCEKPFVQMLKKAHSLLKKNGKILLAIENRLGLKYWAGCKEDHIGRYFEGIEQYPSSTGIKTFSKHELEEIIKDSGFDTFQFYYPYPDYKFMNAIYSDNYLPAKNTLTNNRRNFDLDRFELFNEASVFNSLIENDLFPEFSNSFMVIIQKSGDDNE